MTASITPADKRSLRRWAKHDGTTVPVLIAAMIGRERLHRTGAVHHVIANRDAYDRVIEGARRG